MGVRFENGNLVITIEQEIPIFIPEADFSLPTLPTLPGGSFPDIPDSTKFALKMKADIDAQLKLQNSESDTSIKIDSGRGSGGSGGSAEVEFPKPSTDIEAYLKKFALNIPAPNFSPSVDFPEPPDVAAQALKIKTDLEKQLSLSNSESRISLNADFGRGSEGGGPSLDFKQSDSKLDIPAELAKLSPKLPGIPGVPSSDFPSIPDFTKFGGTDADLDSIRSELNSPESSGDSFNPGGAIVNADIYLKSRISRVKVI